MSAGEAEIVVALDLDAADLSGTVRLEGEERRFVGWLGLLDALQRATGEARASAAVESEGAVGS